MWWNRLVLFFLNLFSSDRTVITMKGDTLPTKIPNHRLILLKDDGEDWSVGFLCPCGCGDKIELLLLKNVTPRWDIIIDRRNRPTLYPSIARTVGCCSHFWVKEGKIVWAN